MATDEEWCPIDNHPGVLTALVKKMGTKGLQVEELWCMDDAVIANLKPVHGIIFLYKAYQDEKVSEMPVITDKERLDTIYFAKQIIRNACVTQALMNVLLNLVDDNFRIGAQLTDLKESSLSLDPKRKGLALTNHENIRAAQNSLSPRQFFGYDIKSEQAQDEVIYNFVGYVPIDGRVIELDMRREGPIDHGLINPDPDWLNLVRPIIMKKIAACSNAKVEFNLMALVTDQRMLLDRDLCSLSSTIPMTNSVEYKEEQNRLSLSMEFEEVKLHRYREEMANKRHACVPLMLAKLKTLGKPELDVMCKQAKARAIEINRVGRRFEEYYMAA